MRALVIWKDVEGFEGIYKISNEGVLISTPRFGVKGGVKKRTKIERGYESYSLHKDGKSCNKLVHRLLAEHFIPNPDNKPYVNHIDGNPSNNTLDNLEWVTQLENIQHAIRTGLMNNKGENHYGAKLTNQEVLEIRDLYKHRIFKQWEIGEIYGAPKSTIGSIIQNRNRKVVEN